MVQGFFKMKRCVMERKEERREEKTGKFSRNPRMFRRTVRASKNCICDQLPKNKNLQVS